MQQLQIPAPPNPDDPSYSTSQQAWNQAMWQWAISLRSKLQQNVRINAAPAQNPILVGTYTETNVLTGTLTGTDVANALCTLANALTAKGIVGPSTSRNNTT